jgi:hypothetical protein
MDHQTMFNIGAGAILAVMGWFARQLWDAVASLREDVHQIEIDLPMHYVRRDEFADNMKEIKDMLGKIFDRLDTKVDKR